MNPEINDHKLFPPSYRNCTISFFPTVTALGKHISTTIAVLRSVAKHRRGFLYIIRLVIIRALLNS